MARPSKWTPEREEQLQALMRLKPSLEDTAAFFKCNPSTVEKFIKRKWKVSFSEFRDQNMAQTRFLLVRTALEQAKSGNTAMLIFSLKNLCGWRDKVEHSGVDGGPIQTRSIAKVEVEGVLKDLITQSLGEADFE